MIKTVPLPVQRKYNGTCRFAYRRPNRQFLTSEIKWLIYVISPRLCELCPSIDVHAWLRFDSLIPLLFVTTQLRSSKLNAVDCSHSQGTNMSGCWCQNVIFSFKTVDRTESAVNRCVHDETRATAIVFRVLESRTAGWKSVCFRKVRLSGMI